MARHTGSNVAGPCRQTECLGVLHPVALDPVDGATKTQGVARNGLSYCVPSCRGGHLDMFSDGIATPVHEGPEAVDRAQVATVTSTLLRTPQNPNQVALLSDETSREEAEDAIAFGEFDAIVEQRDREDGFCRLRNNRVLPLIIRPFVGRDFDPQIGKNPLRGGPRVAGTSPNAPQSQPPTAQTRGHQSVLSTPVDGLVSRSVPHGIQGFQ